MPQLSMISYLVVNFIYENHKHRLENLGQDLLSPLIYNCMQTVFMRKGFYFIIVGVLFTEQYALFVDHRKCR